ncbi:rod shape-determining protein MreC [Candidatus Parcubacteria bacterium]|nr:MAG: rod shape-determining protein MreC [Candidatus Parcubacteria bacterium]
MMNLYRHSKKPSRAPFILATALVVLVFLIDLVSGGSIRAVVREGVARVWSTGTSSISLREFFSTRHALQNENRTLREQITELTLRVAAFEVLKLENQELRVLTGLAEEGSGVSAPVVSSFSTSPYGTFLIGAGEANGLTVGNLVIAGDVRFGGFVIGRIEATDTHMSLVKSLLAPGEATEATVHDIGVVVRGRGGGQGIAEAPREAIIEAGDVVTAATLGQRPLGVVGHVEKDPSGAAQRVYVHLPFSLASIQYVRVVAQ